MTLSLQCSQYPKNIAPSEVIVSNPAVIFLERDVTVECLLVPQYSRDGRHLNADISKTQQLVPKHSRCINSTTCKWKIYSVDLRVKCPTV